MEGILKGIKRVWGPFADAMFIINGCGLVELGGLRERASLWRMGECSHEEGGRTFLLFSNLCLLR